MKAWAICAPESRNTPQEPLLSALFPTLDRAKTYHAKHGYPADYEIRQVEITFVEEDEE